MKDEGSTSRHEDSASDWTKAKKDPRPRRPNMYGHRADKKKKKNVPMLCSKISREEKREEN